MSSPPRVSVIVPAYRSDATLGGCLAALDRQTYRDFETIVVDSGPEAVAETLTAAFPRVRLERSPCRLYPHAARNRGAELARGSLLVFTDPDIYPAADWLARLVGAHESSGCSMVVGALACYGDAWLDRGIHLTKFSKWLPAGEPRAVDVGPTANVLVTRELFDRLGGFRGDLFLGDALFSWQAAESGPLRFEPRAVVEHHHLDSLSGFLRERWRRGVLFGELRSSWGRFGPLRSFFFLAVSLLPVRLGSNLWHTARHAMRARSLGSFVATLPVTVAGHAASLAGESKAYAGLLSGRTARSTAGKDGG